MTNKRPFQISAHLVFLYRLWYQINARAFNHKYSLYKFRFNKVFTDNENLTHAQTTSIYTRPIRYKIGLGLRLKPIYIQIKAYSEKRSSFLFVGSSGNRSTTLFIFGRYLPCLMRTHSFIKNAANLCWLLVFFSADFREDFVLNILLSFSGVCPSFNNSPANFHWKIGNTSGFKWAE